uniref:DnaJ homolog subfamily C member 16 n=1 Tax=Anopheles epiroticus TaxID=199890 RepID=A0A182PTY3_9DIPT
HPDKSKNPDAETRFVEIKQSYELLSDSERRRAYDQYGITNEDAVLDRNRPDYSNYGRFQDPFEHFYGAHNFNFHDQDISLYHRLSITTKYYETNILPKSRQTPQILMFYADWCFSCMKAANSFKKLIDTLEPYGIMFATVNAGHEEQLVRKVGAHSLPCVTMVLDGHNYVYKDSVFNIQHVVDFMRQKLPYKLLMPVTDNTLDNFLSGWSDNRVRVLILEPRTQPRLRYLIIAFHYRERIAFGFTQLDSKDTMNIQAKFKARPDLDTLLIFNEFPHQPIATVTMSDIPTTTLNNIISLNKYLILPRLSSQGMLESIVILWRRDTKHIRYEWINEIVLDKDNFMENDTHDQFFNKTKQKLDTVIQRLLRSTEALSYETVVKDLLDEHAENPIMRIFNRIILALEYVSDNLGQEHILPALSVVGTIVFILTIGYLMSYLLHLEEKNILHNKSKLIENS